MFALHPQLQKDCFTICDLSLSRILLMNDKQFPWIIQVPRVVDISEIIQLSESQQSVLWQESAQLSRVLSQVYSPDKLNIAALGNMVPQLHIHHIVRYRSDKVWPKPVWGQLPAEPYSEDEAQSEITKLSDALSEARLL